MMTAQEFVSYLTEYVGLPDLPLAGDVPLGSQLESLRLVELAVVLEQDLGVPLPDDVNLAALTPAALYADYQSVQ